MCGTCSVLVAQVQGGHAPYAYSWSDPALEGPGPHTVCPGEPTIYTVQVSDGRAGADHSEPAAASGEVRCVEPDARESAYLDGCWARTTTPADGPAEDNPDLIVCEREWLLGAPTWIASKLPKLLRAGRAYQNTYDETRTIVGEPVIVDVYLTNDPCVPEQAIGSLSVDGRPHQRFCFTPDKDYAYALINLKYGVILSDQPTQATTTICAGCSAP
jgi:hypothetical protein